MPTLNQLNRTLRSTINRVSYETVDDASGEVVRVYLRASLTNLKTAGQNIEGFESISSEVNEGDEYVMGTSVVYTATPIPGFESIIGGITGEDISYTSYSFELNYSPNVNADPQQESSSANADLAGQIAAMTGLRGREGWPFRFAVAGSPLAINTILDEFEAFIHPLTLDAWDEIPDWFPDYVETSFVAPSGRLVRTITPVFSRETVLAAISPLVE